MTDRALRRPLAARADRDRRQDRQGAARALGRRRRGADRRRPRARDQRLGRRRPAGRLPASRSPPCATRIARQNADVPGGNVTGRRAASRRCARWAASPTRARSTTWSSPRVNGAPIRVRDIGCAEDGTKEQRSLARLNGVPTVILEVRRQSGANTVEVIEAVKANLERVAAAAARRREARGHPRPVALHLRRAARDQRAPDPGQHPRLPGRARVHAQLALDGHRRAWRFPTSVISTFGMMWALDFTLNSVTMLALVLMVGIVIDDAIVVLENIFRFVEEKKMHAVRGGARGDRGDRPGGPGDDARLVVIFVPVSFMSSISGPVPLPVRHHRGGGGAGQPAGLVHADADDERAPAARRGRRGGTAARRRRLAAAASTPGSTASTPGCSRWSMRHRVAVAIVASAVDRCPSIPLYTHGQAGVHPERRRRGRVRGQRHRARGHQPRRDGRGDAADRAEMRSDPGVRIGAGDRRAAASSAASTRASIYVRIAPHEERTFSLGRLWHGAAARPTRWRAFRGNYTQRDVMRQVRQRFAKFTRPAHSGAQHRRRSTSAAATSTSTSSLRGPELEALAELRRAAPQAKATDIGGIVDADTTLQARQARAAGRDRPRARRRPRRRHRRTSPPRCA